MTLTETDTAGLPRSATAPAHWIQTLPSIGSRIGGYLDLMNPKPEQVNFETIGVVLARVPRFGGHTGQGVYSVAQHCAEGARAILRDTGRADWAGAFLIHDAHEAYIGDIATPVARALAACATEGYGTSIGGAVVTNAIKSLKHRLDVAIYQAAGFSWPLPADCTAVVKSFDLRMGRTERDARLAAPPFRWEQAWEDATPVEDVDTYPWSSGSAEKFWVVMAAEMLPVFRR